MNIRDSKEHLDKLRRLALTKNNDLVNQFKLDLDKIQNDNTLSIELKGFMEFGYNFMIDFCDVLSPFYQIAFQIWMHSDSILENEKLSDKYDGDLNEETYQKLQSFPYEKRKKYLQRYFQNGTYDRIAKTVIGFQPNMKDFEDVLYALSTSKEDNEAVILFKRNIKRDYIRFQQIRKCAEYLALLSEGKKDFDEADEQFCLHHAQSIGSQLIDDPNLLDNEMQELQKTLQTITFCKTACNGLEGLLELQKKIEKKGMHDCIEYLTMFLGRGLFTPAMDMFIRSQPTIAEENIVLDLFHGSKYEDILKKGCQTLKSYYAHTLEEVKSVTVNDRENVIFNEFCDKHFKDEPEYRKQKHGKPFVETPEIHVIETPQRDERSVAYDQLCEKIFPQEKDKQRFQELMGALIEADFLKKTSHGKLTIGTEGNKKYLGYVVKAIEQNLYIEQNKLTKLICKETNKDDTKYTDYSGNDLRTAVSEGKKIMGHRTKRIRERGDEKHRKPFIYKELRGLRL